MEYKIIRDTTKGVNFKEFEQEVNEYLRQGWEPLGGLTSISDNKGNVMWTQAIIRKDVPDKESEEVSEEEPDVSTMP